jgi:hypothetical protein
MKIKDFLNNKIDFKTILSTGPFEVIYNIFNRRIVKSFNNTHIVYDVRTSQPIDIRSEKIIPQYNMMYTGKIDSKFALDSVKYGIKREICDEIMRSDLFEWSIDETTMGTRVAARIIVNKFEK